jgi:hypothetical protein
MDTHIAALLDVVQQGGLVGVLLLTLFLIGKSRGWFITSWQIDELKRERGEWTRIALDTREVPKAPPKVAPKDTREEWPNLEAPPPMRPPNRHGTLDEQLALLEHLEDALLAIETAEETLDTDAKVCYHDSVTTMVDAMIERVTHEQSSEPHPERPADYHRQESRPE